MDEDQLDDSEVTSRRASRSASRASKAGSRDEASVGLREAEVVSQNNTVLENGSANSNGCEKSTEKSTATTNGISSSNREKEEETTEKLPLLVTQQYSQSSEQ